MKPSALVVTGAPSVPRAGLLRRLLAIDPGEADLARRGFTCDDEHARARLETIGRVFVGGYHAALEGGRAGELAARLELVEPAMRGFAYEGAGMGLALQGLLLPWRWRRLGEFLARDGHAHRYMVHVGAGWALAAWPLPPAPWLRRMDPLLRWLALDGFGFYHGYFHPRRSVVRQRVPLRLRGYARHAFHQGLGRALWFVEGASAARVAARVATFARERHADLWSGVGLACTYAGGCDERGLRLLKAAAFDHAPDLAQGAGFAAAARAAAGNPAPHTDCACGALCGATAQEAAAWTEAARPAPPVDEGAYEQWRAGVRARVVATGGCA